MSMGLRSTGLGKSALLAVMAAMMFLLSALAALPAPAGAIPSGPPKLILTLSPDSKEVVVSPSLQGSVAFCGTVKVENPIGQIVVNILSGVDSGWASQSVPSSFEVRDDSIQFFTVTVIVPQATPANVIGTLTVDARAQGPGYVLAESCQATISVRPFFLFKLNCTVPYQEIRPGNQADFDFKVINEGNAADSYELEIENQKELESKGWSVTLSSVAVSGVQPGQYGTFKLTAKSPRENTLMTSEPTAVKLRAFSTGSRNQSTVMTQGFPLYVYVKGSYIGAPGVAEALPIVAIAVVLLVCVAVAIAFIVKRRRARGE